MKHKILITAVFVMFFSVELLFAQNPVQDKLKNTTYTIQDTTQAVAYFNKAIELSNAAQYDSSNALFEKARVIYKEMSDQFDINTIWIKNLQCFNRIGNNFRKQGKYRLALNNLKQGLEGLEKFEGDHNVIAMSFNIIGAVHLQNGNYNWAIENLQKSLSIRLRLFGEEHSQVAGSYHNIGALYRDKGDYDRALEYNEKSLLINLQLRGEEDRWVANNYNNIGSVYRHKGDFDRALEYYTKALSIRLRLLDEEHDEVANSYNSIGTAYQSKGNYDKALEYFKKNLSIVLRLYGNEHPLVASGYSNIGTIYYNKGEYDRALEYHNKFLLINRLILGEEHPDVGTAYINIGEDYRLKGIFDQALKYFRKALAVYLKALGAHHPKVANDYLGLAEVYFQKDDFSNALRYCQKSLISQPPGFTDQSIYRNPPLENLSSEIGLLNALKLKAEILTRMSGKTGKKDLETAFSTYQLAADLIDKIRTGYKAEGSKLLLGENVVEIYDQAIGSAIKLNQITGKKSYKESAFFFAEKGKASVLSHALQETQAKSFAGIPNTILEKEKQLKIDLAFYDTQIEKERQKKEGQDEAKIQDFEGRYFSLKTEYESLIEELETTYPKYYELKYQTQSVSIPELQEVLDSQTTVVEYFTGEKSITIFTVAKHHFEVTTVAKDSLFETLIKQLRTGITKHDYELYAKSAYRLYQFLIQPVVGHLTTRSLIIIPDHVVANVPFEALLTEDGADVKSIDYTSLPYLLREYQVSYAYSANLLLDLLNRSQPDPPRDYLAFAPVFPNGISSGSRAADLLQANHDLDSTRTARTHLPASRDEVLGIQQLFRQSYGIIDRLYDWLFGDKSRVYLENQASEENLKNTDLKEYRYVHFATHGFANETTPELSGLLLAQDTTSTEDDVLFLGEVYNLELNADLVTLSACESGIGKTIKGEGLMSLSRGFLYAGAKNLLVSLWKADDRATCDLMLAFYEEMLKGKPKAQALREAKLRLIGNQSRSAWDYADPSSWAPFILVGK